MTLSEEECEEFVRGCALAYVLWESGAGSPKEVRALKYLYTVLMEALKDHFAEVNNWVREDLTVLELASVNERVMRSGVAFLVAHNNEANDMPVKAPASTWWDAYRAMLTKFRAVVEDQEEAVQKFRD